MTVGLVIVSHSAQLARGVVELAGQMAQGKVQLAAAGGSEGDLLGTSVDKIQVAIQAVDSPDGVLVLLDLGSAILSTEMALEFLEDEQRARILLTYAPLVEGTAAAAIEASLGRSLQQVKEAAEQMAHTDHLRKFKPLSGADQAEAPVEPTEPMVPTTPIEPAETTLQPLTVQLVISNAAGLHARPASQFVQTAARFLASIEVQAHGKQGDAKSILNILSLGVRQDDTITIHAHGSDARAAIDALSNLVNSNFTPGTA